MKSGPSSGGPRGLITETLRVSFHIAGVYQDMSLGRSRVPDSTPYFNPCEVTIGLEI